MAIKVTYAVNAADQIGRLKAAGEAKPEKAQGKQWRAFLRVLKEYLPEHGLDPKHLRKGKELAGIRAMHVGDRDRIVWIGSQEKNAIVVLMVGYRKAGDRQDVYTVAERELSRDTFDEAFAELGMPKPGESAPPPRRVELLPPPEPVAADGNGAVADPAEIPGVGDKVAPRVAPLDVKPTSSTEPLTVH